MHMEPPPAYPDDNSSTEPITSGDQLNVKQPYTFHFSEESIRKGYQSTLVEI